MLRTKLKHLKDLRPNWRLKDRDQLCSLPKIFYIFIIFLQQILSIMVLSIVIGGWTKFIIIKWEINKLMKFFVSFNIIVQVLSRKTLLTSRYIRKLNLDNNPSLFKKKKDPHSIFVNIIFYLSPARRPRS